MTKTLLAIMLALAVLAGVTACKPEGRHAAPAPGKHRVDPAPQPDPAPTATCSSCIGNVQITVWVEQSEERSTVLVNVGQGNQTLIGRKPGSHWDFTVRPGQLVYASVNHFHLGESGWLFLQVVQNNNGSILCEDNNDEDPAAGVQCHGTVVI